MPRHLDSSTTTQMAQIMVQYGRPSRSSWAKSVRSPFGRTIMGEAIWENPIEVRLGDGFQLWMLIRTPWKRTILICVCGWHKIDWKETKHCSDVESTNQRSWFGRTNIFLWSCTHGMYSKTNEISKDIVDNYRTMFESRPTIWKVMPRKMCGTILWVGKQDDSTTLQSIYSMHWWPSFQRRRIEICRRIVKSMLSNCSEMFVLGTNWKTWCSMVSE